MYTKQNPELRDLFTDLSFLAEIEGARQFKDDFYRRRTLEVPITSKGSERNG